MRGRASKAHGSAVGLRFCFVIAAMTIPTHAGSLRTMDGRAYDGDVRFDRSGNLVINTGGGAGIVKVEPDNVLDAVLRPLARATPERGVVLTDGSMLAGVVEGIDEHVARVRRAGAPKSIDVPLERLSHVRFQPASVELADKAPSNASGVLLSNGDFFEGQLRRLDGRTLRVDSLLFGVATFDVTQQAVELVLHPIVPTEPLGMLIRLTDGSRIAASAFDMDGANVRISSEWLGNITVRPDEIAEIQAGGGSVQSLADLKPLQSSAQDSPGVIAIDSTTVGLPPNVAGVEAQHAICVRGPGAVTYAVSDSHRLFTCRAGVPAAVLPVCRVRFAVLVDGRPAWRSGERSSLDEPLTVSVKLDSAQTLTLKVESTLPGEVGAVGAWSDPVLVAGAK
jgi:hypothetical protein